MPSGRPRKPLAMQTGSMSKANRARREAIEAFLECPTTEFDIPECIEGERDTRRFEELRDMIMSIDKRLMTSLDADQLARYVIAERDYLAYSKKLKAAIKTWDVNELAKLQRLQDTAFKQVQTCANALGMNIQSRLKFDVPKPPAKEDDDFDRFE